jgi:hypothetical protein
MLLLIKVRKDTRVEKSGFLNVFFIGTMDALMCDRGDVWDPSEELINDVKGEVDEVQRTLKAGGTFLYITFGQPHFRKRHLQRDCWDIDTKTMGDAFHYFFYTMVKKCPVA